MFLGDFPASHVWLPKGTSLVKCHSNIGWVSQFQAARCWRRLQAALHRSAAFSAEGVWRILEGEGVGISWLVGGLEHVLCFHLLGIITYNNPNWRTHIFQRDRSTTNQLVFRLKRIALWYIYHMCLAVRIPELFLESFRCDILIVWNGIAMDYPRVSTMNDSYKMGVSLMVSKINGMYPWFINQLLAGGRHLFFPSFDVDPRF